MDVIVIVQSEEYTLPRDVAERSQYIKDIMELDTYDGTIKIPHITSRVFSNILEFMFDETYPISREYEGRLNFFQIAYNPDMWERCKSCGKLREKGSKYCIDHKCAFCKRERAFSKTCSFHSCGMNDCTEEVCFKLGINGSLPYCIAHTCEKKGCSLRKSDNSQYCTFHPDGKSVCKSCYRTSIKGSNYCSNHKCKITSCRSAKGAGNFCLRHNCEYPNCTKENQIYSKKGKICIFSCKDHTCCVGGCSLPRVTGKRGCVIHSG